MVQGQRENPRPALMELYPSEPFHGVVEDYVNLEIRLCGNRSALILCDDKYNYEFYRYTHTIQYHRRHRHW